MNTEELVRIFRAAALTTESNGSDWSTADVSKFLHALPLDNYGTDDDCGAFDALSLNSIIAFCDSHNDDYQPGAYIYNDRLCVWTPFEDGTGAWEDADATMAGARWLLRY